MQKTHGNGSERRYFWNVSIAGEGKMTYRSRCSNVKAVRKQFVLRGKTVNSIKPKQV